MWATFYDLPKKHQVIFIENSLLCSCFIWQHPQEFFAEGMLLPHSVFSPRFVPSFFLLLTLKSHQLSMKDHRPLAFSIGQRLLWPCSSGCLLVIVSYWFIVFANTDTWHCESIWCPLVPASGSLNFLSRMRSVVNTDFSVPHYPLYCTLAGLSLCC